MKLLSSSNPILNYHIENGIFAFHLHCFYLDQLSEPLLNLSLDEKLGGRCEFAAVCSKYELHQAAAKVRSVDPFSGNGEQDLFDQVSDMPLGIRRCSSSCAIDSKRVSYIHHQTPLTLIWVIITLGGP